MPQVEKRCSTVMVMCAEDCVSHNLVQSLVMVVCAEVRLSHNNVSSPMKAVCDVFTFHSLTLLDRFSRENRCHRDLICTWPSEVF